MSLSTENLRCFLEGARRLNFRAAAKAVALSLAAFGQRIRQLEDDLGVSLFRRSTRQVLLQRQPLLTADNKHLHTLFDSSFDLALFRYWRDAPGGIDSVNFKRIVCMGTIATIRKQVLQGRGVSVLPAYFIEKELQHGELVEVFPLVKPLADSFRLVFRGDDPKAGRYESIAEHMQRERLQ